MKFLPFTFPISSCKHLKILTSKWSNQANDKWNSIRMKNGFVFKKSEEDDVSFDRLSLTREEIVRPRPRESKH